MDDRFPQRFAGDRAGIDAGSAQYLVPFDQRDLLAKFRGLYGGLLPGGPASNNNHIQMFHNGIISARIEPFSIGLTSLLSGNVTKKSL